MTTIIYKNGTLFADRRQTVTRMKDGKEMGVQHIDNMRKIVVPTNLYVGERKVLAFAAAGDSSWIKYTELMDKTCVEMGVRVNILDKDYIKPMADKTKYSTRMLAVTADSVVVMTLLGEEIEVQEYALTSYVIFGSGFDTPGIVDTITKVSPEVAMADAIAFDPHSGGDVDRWMFGRDGIDTLTLNSVYSKFTRKMLSLTKTLSYIKDVWRIETTRQKMAQQIQTA